MNTTKPQRQAGNAGLQQRNRRAGDAHANVDVIPAGDTPPAPAQTASDNLPATEASDRAVDFRYVPHGHGPCSCCGPWSE